MDTRAGWKPRVVVDLQPRVVPVVAAAAVAAAAAAIAHAVRLQHEDEVVVAVAVAHVQRPPRQLVGSVVEEVAGPQQRTDLAGARARAGEGAAGRCGAGRGDAGKKAWVDRRGESVAGGPGSAGGAAG
ncbi:hypothetical protein PLESTF_001951600 [Pleodorina starrii]|nr:hypothetical protein PLESTF_001951600 [Pleodorina starrii]